METRLKKALTRIQSKLWHFVDDNKIDGSNPNMIGDCSELIGNCTGLIGDIDDCEIYDEDRACGISVSDLIKE